MKGWDILGKTIGYIGAFAVIGAASAVLGTLPIMIGLGIWHHEIDERVPALGFWPVLGLSWALSALAAKFTTKMPSSEKKR
jgi:hypothetical protein